MVDKMEKMLVELTYILFYLHEYNGTCYFSTYNEKQSCILYTYMCWMEMEFFTKMKRMFHFLTWKFICKK